MEKDFEIQEGFICPACKRKTLTVTVWHISRSFTYHCSGCDRIKRPPIMVIFGKEDMLTKEFLQKNIDDSWKRILEKQKHMNDDNHKENI